MTQTQAKRLMAEVRTAWPAFYRGASEATLRRAVAMWAEALAGVDYGAAHAGLVELMRTLRYAPTAAEVVEAAGRAAPGRVKMWRRAPVFAGAQSGAESAVQETQGRPAGAQGREETP